MPCPSGLQLVILFVGALTGGIARAQSLTTSCPTAEEVWKAAQTYDGFQGAPRPVDLAVVDEGPRFSVSLRDLSRTFVEDSRDCSRRAKMAAVFVVLAGPTSLLVPPAAPQPLSVPAPPRRLRYAWLSTRAGAHLSNDLGQGSLDLALSLSGEVGLGARWFIQTEVGAGLPAERQLDSLNLRWRSLWGGTSLGLLASLGHSLSLAPHIGPFLELAELTRTGPFGRGEARWGARPGLGFGVPLRWDVSERGRVQFGPQISAVLWPFDVQATPEGMLGHLPPWYLGVSLSAGWGG